MMAVKRRRAIRIGQGRPLYCGWTSSFEMVVKTLAWFRASSKASVSLKDWRAQEQTQ